MGRRWPSTVVTVIGIVVLLGLGYVSRVGDAMPFAVAYHSSWDGLVYAAGLATLSGALVLTRRMNRRWIWIGLGAVVAVALAAVAVYVAYHAHHTPPRIPDGFRGHLITVTAFHEQLAAPVFATLGFGAAILATALLTRCPR